ncbi:putative toxin-antitoxin system toxin component, PIN family [candidate division KSB1 bacterium]|nr:putative toxin-antitoxin system toxin component, PIN family [candidate division KSB1 bacterium]MBL7094473.1 putative toxin-antitoxin system toxin component, PIN family [candidate division KSB1 bacterium]
MKAVIDTNVVFAGLANRKGAAFKIFQRFFRGQFNWINSVETFDEYKGVLLQSQKISPANVHILLHLLRKRSFFVQIKNNLQVCKDSDDDKFLETAIEGGADFLITKNLKHFPRKRYESVRIVKVATFLTEIEKLYP